MRRGLAIFALGLLVTLLLAVALSQFASREPDGLEYVAAEQGFLDATEEHALANTPLADYGGDSRGRLVVSGLVGVLATLGLGYLVFSLVKPRETTGEQ
ncbi:MAG TPA: PDGLE domain-containing protein [Acidimicrobiia bacterium]|nr:PDGLE domain-containing protein [Acidimicrobiia bacterium]